MAEGPLEVGRGRGKRLRLPLSTTEAAATVAEMLEAEAEDARIIQETEEEDAEAEQSAPRGPPAARGDLRPVGPCGDRQGRGRLRAGHAAHDEEARLKLPTPRMDTAHHGPKGGTRLKRIPYECTLLREIASETVPATCSDGGCAS